MARRAGPAWYFASVTRYEVLERMGAGRMAEIFRGKAIAAGGFEKPVAIKRILPHLSSDPRFVELLIAEAKILSVLRHRNVVQIFDVGVGDDGHHFLVMEFVDGVDLGALQRHLEKTRQRLPIDLVLHVGAEVCEALDHAQHATGPDGEAMRLVHRDVTPTNVLVSRAGEVKLTDFGLAKRPEDGTSAGGLRGRYGYVSPEQASGTPVDGRADVFAVAVIMWELAVGRRLFSGLPDFEALRSVREGTIARVRELDASLPADLDAILVEALARDPAKRLPSAGELGKRLRGLRYSLDDSTGDPAAALGRLVVGVERSPIAVPEISATAPASGKSRNKRTSQSFDGAEPTVLRIRTADGFADDREGTGLSNARRVLDHFEEEQTRMSRLPSGAFEEISTVGGSARRDSDSLEVPTFTAVPEAPLHLPRDSGEIAAPPPPADLDDPPLEQRRPRARAASRADVRTGRTPPPVPTRPPPRPAAAPAPAPAAEPVAPAAYPRPSTSAPYAFGSTAAPRAQHPHSRPSPTSRPVFGFGKHSPLRWWRIAIAALVIAALSFLITRAALDPDDIPTGPSPLGPDASATLDAAVPLDAVPLDAVPLDAVDPTPLDASVPAVDDAAPADADPLADAAASSDDATTTVAPLTDAVPAPTVTPTPPRKKAPVRKPPRKKKRRR